MKRFFLLLLVVLSLNAVAQTYVTPTDNLDIQSNSWIIFNPGNYALPDPGSDGIIRINNAENIILDGSGVVLDGGSDAGYMIKINNSSNIEIRNFELITNYKYAIYITNSDSIKIHDNTCNWNKVDSSGWINVWANYSQALGGGVMMYNVQQAEIWDNEMRYQNDGVALYHCDSIIIWDNLFNWNTSFGIRMFFTDYCHIHHNNCSHVNRPFTDPSDCAALLMIVSNENLVEYNNLEASGDGVFLGQYEYSSTPNNNVFLYNECSFSPHNAIEATFADGNIYKHNVCNYSHYGMWLGYSFNSIVDSNEVIGNQNSGIAIDRGYNNSFTGNVISENPWGFELWEGSTIPGYENQYSSDYQIHNNVLEGNRVAVKSSNTEHLVMYGNTIVHNEDGILIEGSATEDTIMGNFFKNSTFYHIENKSAADIYALNNTFFAPDQEYIECKIFDENDDPGKGEVIFEPFSFGNPVTVSNDLVADMTESPAQWYAYAETSGCFDSTLYTEVFWDSTDYKTGGASVHCKTRSGWYIGLQYWPAGDTVVSWNLTEQDTLVFWLKTHNNSGYGFQYYHVRIGNHCGGYFKYSGSVSVLNSANGVWKQVRIPLSGGGSPNYVRSQVGEVSVADLSYVTVYADTWDCGFEILLDGMHFTSIYTGDQELSESDSFRISQYPNPFIDKIYFDCNLSEAEDITIRIYDLSGKQLSSSNYSNLNKGFHLLMVDGASLLPGIYVYRITSGEEFKYGRLIKQ